MKTAALPLTAWDSRPQFFKKYVHNIIHNTVSLALRSCIGYSVMMADILCMIHIDGLFRLAPIRPQVVAH